jgi:hypothetical protein
VYIPIKSRVQVHFVERLLSPSTLVQKLCLEVFLNQGGVTEILRGLLQTTFAPKNEQ